MSKIDSYRKKGSFKYFIGYIHKGNAFPIPICIKPPQLKGYFQYFKDNKCINLLVDDEELLKKCSEIWNKISNLLEKEYDSAQ